MTSLPLTNRIEESFAVVTVIESRLMRFGVEYKARFVESTSPKREII
jgi:hypothetical protein